MTLLLLVAPAAARATSAAGAVVVEDCIQLYGFGSGGSLYGDACVRRGLGGTWDSAAAAGLAGSEACIRQYVGAMLTFERCGPIPDDAITFDPYMRWATARFSIAFDTEIHQVDATLNGDARSAATVASSDGAGLSRLDLTHLTGLFAGGEATSSSKISGTVIRSGTWSWGSYSRRIRIEGDVRP